ncbi:hypothetical protein [Yersinia enterocolitica]|uniref:hypothetical protein n=1 Tax=Yersinia enterocolitica TaxID=630 RepID=UPI003D08E0AA
MKELDGFTVEEIEEIISSCQQEIHNTPTSDEFPVSPRLLLSLARIALAAKRAEPVAWVVGDEEIADFKNGREVCVMRDCDDEQLDYLPLYTTPQLNSPEIPDGWKLVPIEPSWEMLSADGCKEHHKGETCLHHDNRKRIWQAMLAAAPEKPL